MRLDGQHAFITGGGSGIGLACARALLEDGARVTIMGRGEERLAAAAQTLAEYGEVWTASGDVCDETRLAEAIEAAEDRAPLTIAVANAGTGTLSPVIATEDAEWQRVLQTNLSGTFYTFKHAGAAIARAGGGAMCAISSIAGVRSHRFMAAYCVSKAGIDTLVRNTADELGVAGVRVNSVCPGLVRTELSQALQDTREVLDDYLDCMPIRRVGVPDDIARAVRFLCGPEANWITGVVLSVDGGHHLRRGPNVEPFARAAFGEDVVSGRLARSS